MKTFSLIFLLCLALDFEIKAQLVFENTAGFSLCGGIAFPINKFNYQNNSDNILSMAKRGFCIKGEADYRVLKNYELIFSIRNFTNSFDDGKANNWFLKDIPVENYYVSFAPYYSENNYINTIPSIGIKWIKSYNRFSIEPEINLGISFFDINFSKQVHLKEKGSNYYIDIYCFSNTANNFFVINPFLALRYIFLNKLKFKLGAVFYAEYLNQNAIADIKTSSTDIFGVETNNEWSEQQRIELINFYIGVFWRFGGIHARPEKSFKYNFDK